MLSKLTKTKTPTSTDFSDSYYVASQWELVRRKFKRHKLARVGVVVLAIFYAIAIFAGFLSLNDFQVRDVDHVTMPPQNLHFFDEQGKFHLRPFVCDYKYTLNMAHWREHLKRILVIVTIFNSWYVPILINFGGSLKRTYI